MDASPVVSRVAPTVDESTLRPMLGWQFTDEETREAKEQFTKAVDAFVEKSGNLGFIRYRKCPKPSDRPVSRGSSVECPFMAQN
jgi:hypothetical protein